MQGCDTGRSTAHAEEFCALQAELVSAANSAPSLPQPPMHPTVRFRARLLGSKPRRVCWVLLAGSQVVEMARMRIGHRETLAVSVIMQAYSDFELDPFGIGGFY